MSLQSTCIEGLRWLALAVAPLLLGNVASVSAQTLESMVMPGRLSEKHAKYEADCSNCHVRFDRAAQSRTCLACHDHRDVAEDIRKGTGYHGRIREHECRSCHTEHKGPEARLVALDDKRFDHKLTDFRLQGKHLEVKCASCHRPGVKHRNAPGTCAGCHNKDDRHKGGLGAACANCHTEESWKNARFDHGKTRFALLQRHAAAKCADCHPDQRYRDTSRECYSCHRKDDEHKGKLGNQCDKCHDASRWKAGHVDHDRDTRFPLRLKHADLRCTSCHKTPGLRDRLPVVCFGCHQRDDETKGHRGRYGEKCETCHNEKAWKAPTFEHDRDTRYALRGKHRPVKCDSCHRGRLYVDKLEPRCYSCHQRDDPHKGQLGADCRACHDERSWRETSFEHARARFALAGRHVGVECRKCHATPAYKDASMACAACHAKDDKHKGRFAAKCDSCHDASGWKGARYDHDARTRFRLEGAHARATCHACHKEPMAEAVPLSGECLACHKDDDVHLKTYGPLCQRCHVPENWRKIVRRDGDSGVPAAGRMR